MKNLFFFSGLFLIGVGCSENKNPLPSNTHPDSWMQPQSPDFHGTKVLTVGSRSCKSCHGDDFTGGESKIACKNCHESYPHPENFADSSGLTSHRTYVAAHNWDLKSCKKCHGEAYTGGRVRRTCLICHSGEDGPEACNGCHGNDKNAAPPEDLEGHIETSYVGVGAHQNHVLSYKNCKICHVMPDSFSDPAHIDTTPHAEVNKDLKWDRIQATCATPCHRHKDKSYVWNE